jgi:hypothetical protein
MATAPTILDLIFGERLPEGSFVLPCRATFALVLALWTDALGETQLGMSATLGAEIVILPPNGWLTPCCGVLVTKVAAVGKSMPRRVSCIAIARLGLGTRGDRHPVAHADGERTRARPELREGLTIRCACITVGVGWLDGVQGSAC